MSNHGFRMPFQALDGQLPAPSTEEMSVDASIRRIINTRVRERPHRPEVGSRVWDFLFESTGNMVRARVGSEVRRVLSAQERRISVTSVVVTPLSEVGFSSGGNGYRIHIAYRFRSQQQTTDVDIVNGES